MTQVVTASSFVPGSQDLFVVDLASARAGTVPPGIQLLSGAPSVDEDLVYTGTLARFTVIDFCESKGRRGPGDDERVWCAETLSGWSTINVELKVYGDEGRGAYLQTSPGPGPYQRSARGTCDQVERCSQKASRRSRRSSTGRGTGMKRAQ